MYSLKLEMAYVDPFYIFFRTEKSRSFTDLKPGKKWFRGFQQRFPEFKVRKARLLEEERGKVTKFSIRQWFKNVSTDIAIFTSSFFTLIGLNSTLYELTVITIQCLFTAYILYFIL